MMVEDPASYPAKSTSSAVKMEGSYPVEDACLTCSSALFSFFLQIFCTTRVSATVNTTEYGALIANIINHY